MATQTDLHAAMSPTRIGTVSGTIDGVAISYTSGRYWHLNVSTVDTAGSGALATALNTSITGGGGSAVVAFSAANLTYTITKGSNFSINLGAVLAAALGMASGAQGPATSFTSTKRPLYVIRPLVAAQSMVSDNYNPAGRIKSRVAEDGVTQYGISPYSMPIYNDWTHMLEADAPLANGGAFSSGGSGHAVMTRNATATMPWSWQAFYDVVRAEEYFAWCSQTAPPTAATATVYKMRGEAAHFQPQRAVADYGLWNIRMAALYIGAQ